VAETSIPISQDDIASLGRQLESVMGDNERALLAGIVAVAAKAIRGTTEDPSAPQVIHSSYPEPPVVVEVRDTLPSLLEQIAGAFTPGAIDEAADLALHNVKVGHVASVRVGHGG
jgi:hypothetical protein